MRKSFGTRKSNSLFQKGPIDRCGIGLRLGRGRPRSKDGKSVNKVQYKASTKAFNSQLNSSEPHNVHKGTSFFSRQRFHNELCSHISLSPFDRTIHPVLDTTPLLFFPS